MASWKWMVIGLTLATIFTMWIDGSIQSLQGYALIAVAYYAVWIANREIKGGSRPSGA